MTGPKALTRPLARKFAPGCALMIYKPHLAERLHEILVKNVGPMDVFLTCCHHIPPLARGTEMINVCPGCDRRYRENYTESTTISLWEVLTQGSFFPFPDYAGREMTIIDACPTRSETRVHDAVRELVRRMNILLVEPRKTRTHSTCCGDSLWGVAPEPKVIAQMKKKAATMPTQEIITYCVSCSKAMFIGGKRPRYLVDLLFNEETVPKTYLPAQWHKEVDEFIEAHR